MRKFGKVILAAALAAFSPSPVFACAACYGQSSDPLAHGMNWGIFTLLGIVVLMLSSIATFFVVLIRREAAAQAKKLAEENLLGAKI
jgi:threonine/homoserine/homoserine lactone efflux protein